DDHTLYASHTVWATKDDFTAWTKSEQFRAAHANAGNNRGKVEYLSGPHFEGFDVIIHEGQNGEDLPVAAQA
ncbi:MAG: antibiotic biosynthesis monooxygenase, partial [Agrobacterium vaccinii]